MKKKWNFSIAKLFNNDRFVLIFSVFAAIILWFVMATFNTEERPKPIEVPITVKLSQEAQEAGYQIFDQSNATAKVSVKGSSLVVNQLTEQDLLVEAQGSTAINRKGDFTFTLAASKQGSQSDYEIVSVDPGSVIVNIDKKKTVTLDINDNIKYKVDDKYFGNSPQLSAATITLSGPETEITKIASASVELEVPGTLMESFQSTTKVVLKDTQGKILDSSTLKQKHITIEGSDDIDVTIQVLNRVTVPVVVDYTNKPDKLDPASIVTIDHQTIEVGAPTQQLSTLKSVGLASPIDFSNVAPGHNNFALSVELPQECKNLSEVYEVHVAFNLDNFATKTIVVEDFRIKNLAATQNAAVTTKNLAVTIVGPKDLLDSLASNHVYGEIDMAGKEYFAGSTEMPVKIAVNSEFSAWAYGNYKLNVNVSEKAAA